MQVVLTSRFSMWMAWGPELTFFCNDAYRRDTLGKKYPWALGRSAREVWAEIWPDIGPRIETVLRTGVATWDEALQLFLERSGYAEETYHTFSYSPLADDDGRDRRHAVRRLRGDRAGDRRAPAGDAARPRRGLSATRTEEEVLAPRRATSAANAQDLPFALTYLYDDDARPRLRAASGIAPGHPVAREPAWPVGGDAGRARTRRAADRRLGRAAAAAVVLPFLRRARARPPASSSPALNRYRPLDDDYRGFLGLVAGQIAAGSRARAPRGPSAGARRRWPSSTGQDRVLHQRQPRAAHAADAAARPGRGRARRR